MMFFSSTDLPVPEGPRTAEILPRGTSKVMFLSTVWLPKRLVTPLSAITASGPGVAEGSSAVLVSEVETTGSPPSEAWNRLHSQDSHLSPKGPSADGR